MLKNLIFDLEMGVVLYMSLTYTRVNIICFVGS